MANPSDKPRRQVSGPVMRRTDDHIIDNSEVKITRSGDDHLRGQLYNGAIRVFPDSDPRWGKTQLDPDWPDQEEN